MTIGKGFELRVGPAVEDPVLDTRPGIFGLVLTLIPVILDLSDQTILVGLCSILGLHTLLL